MPGQVHRTCLFNARSCAGLALRTLTAGKVLMTGDLPSGSGVAVCQVRVCPAILLAQSQEPKWVAAETAGLGPDKDPWVRHPGVWGPLLCPTPLLLAPCPALGTLPNFL